MQSSAIATTYQCFQTRQVSVACLDELTTPGVSLATGEVKRLHRVLDGLGSADKRPLQRQVGNTELP